MTKTEYSKLCIASAALNIASAAINPKHNEGFTNPQQTAKDEILKAYLIIDRLLINHSSYKYQ